MVLELPSGGALELYWSGSYFLVTPENKNYSREAVVLLLQNFADSDMKLINFSLVKFHFPSWRFNTFCRRCSNKQTWRLEGAANSFFCNIFKKLLLFCKQPDSCRAHWSCTTWTDWREEALSDEPWPDPNDDKVKHFQDLAKRNIGV